MGNVPSRPTGVKGNLRFCPTWIWLRVSPGHDRLWSELAAGENADEAYTKLPSAASILGSTGLSHVTQKTALEALESCGALSIVKNGPSRRDWYYRTFYDAPPLREQDKRSPEPPQPRKVSPGRPPEKEPLPRSGPISKMLLSAWLEVYAAELGMNYTMTGADKHAITAVRTVARERQWERQQARAFFRVAIKYLREQDYWKTRVTLASVAFKLNEVLQTATTRHRPPDPLQKVAERMADRMREIDPAAFELALRRYDGSADDDDGPGGGAAPPAARDLGPRAGNRNGS